jgi:hypothetical protein
MAKRNMASYPKERHPGFPESSLRMRGCGATILTAAGLSTGAGLPFTAAAVRRIRDTYQIPLPAESVLAPGELTVHEVAARLHIAADVVYCRISTGRLRARRLGRRLGVPFSPEIEAT